MDLQPTRLGTKEHWDAVYDRELQNFESFGDEGEVWFGDEAIQAMLRWIRKNIPRESKTFVLDVGTGNGSMLVALAEEEEFDSATLCGIDYSNGSTQLAQSIAKSHDLDILFATRDFLTEDPPTLPGMESATEWDLILDKGTFDAIALASRREDGSSLLDSYPRRAARLLKAGAFFLITSCNFTVDELKNYFETDATKLRYHSQVERKVFAFGGQTGSTFSTVAFQKTTDS